jgi:hypothetical protein
MKSKDQTLLEEAYKKIHKDYLKDAMINPSLYEISLYPMRYEDYEGNTITATEASIYTADNGVKVFSKVYEEDSIHNDELDQLIDVFEKHNPEGITDNR